MWINANGLGAGGNTARGGSITVQTSGAGSSGNISVGLNQLQLSAMGNASNGTNTVNGSIMAG